jgi:cytidylate kinase
MDGPAGSGKSTAARNLAAALGIAFLDTGATYRATTLRAMRLGIDLADEDAMAEVARGMDLHLQPNGHDVRVLLDGEDVSEAIRTESVSENSGYAAKPPNVRAVLVDLQRHMGAELGDFVTEGRDQGTVVFPEADVKFFITASPEVRAQRRVDQLRSAGEAADFDEVLAAIRRRDHRDSNRTIGALRPAEDAIHVDTTEHSQEETLQLLLTHVKDAS